MFLICRPALCNVCLVGTGTNMCRCLLASCVIAAWAFRQSPSTAAATSWPSMLTALSGAAAAATASSAASAAAHARCSRPLAARSATLAAASCPTLGASCCAASHAAAARSAMLP